MIHDNPKTFYQAGIVGSVSAKYIWGFHGWFSKASFFNHYKITLLEFLIKRTHLTHKLYPASQFSKIKHASQAELACQGALSYPNECHIFTHSCKKLLEICITQLNPTESFVKVGISEVHTYMYERLVGCLSFWLGISKRYYVPIIDST